MINRSPDETKRIVKATRVSAGLSREELADAIDLSPGTLGRIERGERGINRWEWNAIAEICSVKRDFIEREIGEEDYTPFLRPAP